MSVNVQRMRCSPEDVFRVLGDGWTYPSWVVGVSRMRRVGAAWPAAGARLHHSVGTWPLLLDDETTMREFDPPRRAVMRAKGWPIGEAEVVFDVRPHDRGCVVRLEEQLVAGPGRIVPLPVRDLMLFWRNRETLQRLTYLAEGMASVDPAR